MGARIILGATASQGGVRESDRRGVDFMGSNRKRVGAVVGTVLFAAIVATSGCKQPTKVAAKSPTPVHVLDVAL